MADKGGMNKESVVTGTRKGVSQHQGVVQPETPHDGVAVQGTPAMREGGVANQEGTVGREDIAYDVLVAAVWETVNDGVAVAGVEDTDAHPF